MISVLGPKFTDNNVDIEPQLLLPVTGENLRIEQKTRATRSKGHYKIKGFLSEKPTGIFHVRVFDSKSNRYLKKALPQWYIQNEREKKQKYYERVLEIYHGSPNPIQDEGWGGGGKGGKRQKGDPYQLFLQTYFPLLLSLVTSTKVAISFLAFKTF